MPPERRADRAHAGASRTLLPPELAACAAHFALFLGLVRPATQPCEIPPRSLMQEVLIDFGTEDRVRQFYLADLLAIQINYIHDRHIFISLSILNSYPFSRRPASKGGPYKTVTSWLS